jgi:hypothetical protein
VALVIGYRRVSKTVVRLQISKSGGWSEELCVGCDLSWTVPYEVFAFGGLLSSVVSRLETSCKRYNIVCYKITKT